VNRRHEQLLATLVQDRSDLLDAIAAAETHLRECMTCAGAESHCSIAAEIADTLNQRETALRVMLRKLPDDVPGICRECACTDDRACNPPCSWVDAKHTLCSTCDAKERAR
jgi:hypothetical protein